MDGDYEYQHTLETVRRLKGMFYKTKERYFTEKKAQLEEMIAQINTLQCPQIVKRISRAESIYKKHINASLRRHRMGMAALHQNHEALTFILKRQRETNINEVLFRPKPLTKGTRVMMESDLGTTDPSCTSLKRKVALGHPDKATSPHKSRPANIRKNEHRNTNKDKRIPRLNSRVTRSRRRDCLPMPSEVACIVYRLQPHVIQADLDSLYSWHVAQESQRSNEPFPVCSKQKVPHTNPASQFVSPYVSQHPEASKPPTAAPSSRNPLTCSPLPMKRLVTNTTNTGSSECSSLSYFTQQRLKEKLLYQLHPDLQLSRGCTEKFNKELHHLPHSLTRISLPLQAPVNALSI